MRAYRSFRASRKLGRVPGYFNTQEACNETVCINPLSLVYVHDRFKCDKAVEEGPWLLEHVPDQYMTQEMCGKVAGEDPGLLEHVPDRFKTQEMCNEAVRGDLFSLQFVPDWFVTQQQIDKWYDDDYVYNDNEMIEWY